MAPFSALLLLTLLGPTARPGLEEDAPPPSQELLEFIGSFQTADGQWIDPLSLPEEEPDQSEDEATKDKPDDQDPADTDPER